MSTPTSASVINGWSEHYQRFDFDAFGDEGDFARRQLLNPAIFSLLGDPRGKAILDAGCGNGYLSRLLAARGASVTGIEPADPTIQRAIEREQAQPLGITYRQQDLAASATFTDLRGAFDAVIANMVFMDIPDDVTAIRGCIGALKPGGLFIFSLLHPCFEESSAEWPAKGYVAVSEYLSEHATPLNEVYTFHRPLSHYLNTVIREGCILREVVEPRLDPSWAAQDKRYERDAHVPSFIVISAAKG